MARRLGVVLATTGAGIALVAAGPTGSAGAAPTTCQGQPVTIAATADYEELLGTDGDDVISTAGIHNVTVRAMGGDDLVCATAFDRARVYGDGGEDTLVDEGNGDIGGDYDGSNHLVGGAGSDHFVAHRSTWLMYDGALAGLSIDAAAGTVVDGEDTDTFVGRAMITGSRFSDRYIGSSGDDRYVSGPFGESEEGDVISTGVGDDQVGAFRSSVNLGPGDDRARVSGGGSVSGGEGADEISLHGGGVALGGPGADRLFGSDFEGSPPSERTPFRLVGGRGNDVLLPAFPNGLQQVDCPSFCARGRLEGGSGVDTLDLEYARMSVVDLAAGRVRVQGGASTIRSVENVLGSHRADVIRGDARRNRIKSRGGDDRVAGRGGRDVLIGDRGEDVLVGGRGRDRADGGEDRDRCQAEVRRSC
ncbi:hypothetical protein [Nocardioides lijunqiniae]|uniref:hypothetical protein n=1 Tax=Nocardioides lijunqiniae TaxID=2760832 RepID=UPI00187823C6|nr:hypothetical protein [Nocardioides lijunqiniae]